MKSRQLCAAIAIACSLGTAGAQTDGVELNASVDGFYPPRALLALAEDAVRVRYALDSACKISQVTTVENAASADANAKAGYLVGDFRRAAVEVVRAARPTCAAGFTPGERELLVEFRLGDVALTSEHIERQKLPIGLKRGQLTYPPGALRNSVEGKFIVRIPIDTDCKIGIPKTHAYMLSRSGGVMNAEAMYGRLFEEQLTSDITEKWRFEGECPKQPIVAQQLINYQFEGQGGAKQLKEIGLRSALSMFKRTPSFYQNFSTKNGTCPALVAFTSLQPQAPNRVRTVAANSGQLDPSFLQWAAQQRLIDEFLFDFFGTELLFHVPCTDVALAPSGSLAKPPN